MAHELGHFDTIIEKKDSNGFSLPVSSASVTIYKEPAIANGAGSIADSVTDDITVHDSAGIEVGDVLNAGIDTVNVTVNTVAATTINVTNSSGSTFTWSDDDFIIPTTNKPTIYSDEVSSTSITNPISTSATGRASCFMPSGEYCYIPTGTGLTAQVYPFIIDPPSQDAFTHYADDFNVESATGGIQEAYDALPAEGGVVELGTNTYTLTAALDPATISTLRGAGMGKSIIKVANSTAITAFLNSGTATYLEFRDFTLDGNDANQASGNGQGFTLDDTSQLIMNGVEIKNLRSSGIHLTANTGAQKHVSIRNNYIHDTCSADSATGASGINVDTVTSAISQINITDNLIEDTGDGNANTVGHGIRVGGANQSEVVISDNIVVNSRVNGIVPISAGKVNITGNYVKSAGLSDTANGGNGIFCSNAGQVVVDGNTVDTIPSSSDNGIEISGAVTDAVITNNRVTGIANGNKVGISFGETPQLVISGNVCHNNTGAGIKGRINNATPISNISITGNVSESNDMGIECGGWKNITITGNLCQNNTNAGIFVPEGVTTSGSNPSNISITGNTCVDNTTNGIHVDGETTGAAGTGERLSITGNTCHNNGDRGILVLDCNGVAITGNVVEENSESGMHIGSVTDCVITGNMVKNNGVGDVGTTDDDGITLGGTCDSIFIDGNAIIDNADAGGFGINGTGATLTNVKLGVNFFLGNTATTSANLGAPAFTDLDTTPSVAGGLVFREANTGATSITDFGDGYDSQEITIHFSTGNTTLVEGATIKTDAEANLTPDAGNVVRFIRIGGVWYMSAAQSSNAA